MNKGNDKVIEMGTFATTTDSRQKATGKTVRSAEMKLK